MRTRPLVLSVVVGLILCSGVVAGHHELAEIYERGKMITLQGKVTSVEWVNPHVVLTLAADGPAAGSWRLELDPPGALARRGWKREQVAASVSMTVTAHVAKDGSSRAVAETVTLATGEKLTASTDGSWQWRRMIR